MIEVDRASEVPLWPKGAVSFTVRPIVRAVVH